VIDAGGEIIETVQRATQEELISGADVSVDCLATFTNKIGEPCVVMFRNDVALGGFRTGYYSFGDVDLWLRILAKGDLVIVDEVLCRYRFRDTSQRSESIAGLHFLGDIFLLADCHKHLLFKAGLSEREVYRLAARAALFWLRYFEKVLEIDTNKLLECLRERHGQFDAKETQSSDFRLAALAVLFYAKELEDELWRKDNQSSEMTKLELEKKLSEMGNSVSWRITKPLRDMKRSAGEVSKLMKGTDRKQRQQSRLPKT
jgi:hypothetical protein